MKLYFRSKLNFSKYNKSKPLRESTNWNGWWPFSTGKSTRQNDKLDHLKNKTSSVFQRIKYQIYSRKKLLIINTLDSNNAVTSESPCTRRKKRITETVTKRLSFYYLQFFLFTIFNSSFFLSLLIQYDQNFWWYTCFMDHF